MKLSMRFQYMQLEAICFGGYAFIPYHGGRHHTKVAKDHNVSSRDLMNICGRRESWERSEELTKVSCFLRSKLGMMELYGIERSERQE